MQFAYARGIVILKFAFLHHLHQARLALPPPPTPFLENLNLAPPPPVKIFVIQHCIHLYVRICVCYTR